MSNIPSRNPVFLAAAIHAFFCGAPSYLFSVLGLPNPALKIFLPEPSALTDHALARCFFELCSLSVTAFSFMYLRLYLDGASQHPLVLFTGGTGKIIFSFHMLSWYLNGYANVEFLLISAIPDFAFGVYYCYLWKNMGMSFSAKDAIKSD